MSAVMDEAPKSNAQELWTRVISGAAMAVPVLILTYMGPPMFTVLVAIAATIMGWEWSRMCKRQLPWMLTGAVYIALPCGALIWLRGDDFSGFLTLLWLFAVVWSADIGAYLTGKSIGGPRLAPRISPKKTWSGFLGGIIIAGIVAGLFAAVWDGEPILLALWGVAIAIASQGGDLVESGAKRYFGVKDTSSLIPGHGGVLDRVDALMAGALALALLKFTVGQAAIPWL